MKNDKAIALLLALAVNAVFVLLMANALNWHTATPVSVATTKATR